MSVQSLVGVVVSAGKALNTVKVRVAKQVWNSHLRKNFTRHRNILADDHLCACVPGDVVRLAPGFKTSKMKRHVVDTFVNTMRTGEERAPPEGAAGWVKRREEKAHTRDLRIRRKRTEVRKAAEAAEAEKVGEVD